LTFSLNLSKVKANVKYHRKEGRKSLFLFSFEKGWNIMAKKYKEDGVDVKAGDAFSSYAGKLCQSTFKNSPFVTVRDFSRGHFRGPRAFRLRNLPRNCYIDIAPDGDGTKVEVISAAGDFPNAARGWVAMTRGDITRWGGKGIILVNNLDTENLGEVGDPRFEAHKSMMDGLKRIADEEHLIMFKGETAELPGIITSRNKQALVTYSWCGVCLGVYNPRTIITGDGVKKDMLVMALRELGLRNNGFSSLRKGMAIHYGQDWHNNPDAQDDIRAAATPAVLYDSFLERANGWRSPDFLPEIPMYLIVHVTGGAIKSKFAEDILFPRGLSAELDNLWDLPPIMRKCAEWRGLSDRELYEIWNGGQGALVVIEEKDAEAFISLGRTFGIDVKKCGRITREKKPQVIIHSMLNGEKIPFVA